MPCRVIARRSCVQLGDPAIPEPYSFGRSDRDMIGQARTCLGGPEQSKAIMRIIGVLAGTELKERLCQEVESVAHFDSSF